MDKRKKGHGELVIASSDPAKNLEFVEEALNQVAFLISVEITKQVSYELHALQAIRAYLKTKYSCTISTKSKWKQDGQKQERTQQAYHSV